MRPKQFLLLLCHWADGIWRCQELRRPWEQGMRNRDREKNSKCRKVLIRWWAGTHRLIYKAALFREEAGKEEAPCKWTCCAGEGVNVVPTVQAGESL